MMYFFFTKFCEFVFLMMSQYLKYLLNENQAFFSYNIISSALVLLNPFTSKKLYALIQNSEILPLSFQNTINLSMKIKLLMKHMSQSK